MTDLVFVSESRLFDRDVQGFISRTFFSKFVSTVALQEANTESVIWVIAKRDSEYFLQSRLKVDLIQRYTQGRMSGWYVINCSKNFGGHIFSPNDLELVIDTSSTYESFPDCDTVDVLPHSLAELLIKYYKGTLRKTNIRLSNDNRRKFLMNYVKKFVDELSSLSVNQIESELRVNFYESELLLLASLPSIDDPYVSTAMEIFSVINEIPLTSIESYSARFVKSNISNGLRKYYTDCMLRTFTEDDLSAREMIWNKNSFSEEKLVDGLLKTNLAEQRHQEILRQLISQFTLMGMTPLGSSSIDLAIEFDDTIALFEIKSTTLDNYKDQALKGCGQLAEYAFNLSNKTNKKIFKFLILEVPIDGPVDSVYVSNICKTMNVATIDFNFNNAWPDRCLLPDKTSMIHIHS